MTDEELKKIYQLADEIYSCGNMTKIISALSIAYEMGVSAASPLEVQKEGEE